MNKKFLLGIIFITFLGLGAFLFYSFSPREKRIISYKTIDDVSKTVDEFGKKLKSVSLQSPKEILEKQIIENYKEFLSPELLAGWINDPSKALEKKIF
jgi:hypothetical protein